MVVYQAGGLHQGVTDGRPDKAPQVGVKTTELNLRLDHRLLNHLLNFRGGIAQPLENFLVMLAQQRRVTV